MSLCMDTQLIVSIRHLVYVTLYRWSFGVQVWMRHFIMSGGSIVLVQFCFDILILMCLFCLFCIAEFYVMLTVHLGTIFVNNHLDAQHFFMYVYFYSHPNLHTKRSSIQSDIYQMSYWYNYLSWWWAHDCPKHVKNTNKCTWKKILRQVVYLRRLYRDARSTERRILQCTVNRT